MWLIIKYKKLLFFLILLLYKNFCISVDPRGEHLDKSLQNAVSSPTPWLHTRSDFVQFLPKGGIIAEIGVAYGDFSEMILQIAKPAKLYLIDCWEKQPDSTYPGDISNQDQYAQDNCFKIVNNKFVHDPRVVIIKSYSIQAAKLFEDNFFDWVYIDANHTYEAVKNDLNAWFAKVKFGGFLCGHDYSKRLDVILGVIPAVNEFVKNKNLKIDVLTFDEGNSYAIKKNT